MLALTDLGPMLTGESKQAVCLLGIGPGFSCNFAEQGKGKHGIQRDRAELIENLSTHPPASNNEQKAVTKQIKVLMITACIVHTNPYQGSPRQKSQTMLHTNLLLAGRRANRPGDWSGITTCFGLLRNAHLQLKRGTRKSHLLTT